MEYPQIFSKFHTLNNIFFTYLVNMLYKIQLHYLLDPYLTKYQINDHIQKISTKACIYLE